jgi:23S rRNA (cytidine1920-2'-O)/16S rRNA (cytidine1409-2'-O)-methyltransferase
MDKTSLLDLLRRRFPEKDDKALLGAVLRGDVTVNGRTILKPGSPVSSGSEVSVKAGKPFVSRGGEKLAHAIASWGHGAAGKAFLDAGCSTGGFADCLLKRGASMVYCVDVGYNQLDWRIRSDPRVRVMERTNVMALSRQDFSPLPDQAVADLSFRSLRGAAAHILSLTSEGQGIFLVKPQFEWLNPSPEFDGVVRDAHRAYEILDDLLRVLFAEGVFARKAVMSPRPGRKGNVEFLFLLSTSGEAPFKEISAASLLGLEASPLVPE